MEEGGRKVRASERCGDAILLALEKEEVAMSTWNADSLWKLEKARK